MPLRISWRLVALSGIAAAVASCSSHPVATPASTPPPSATLPHSGAPKVSHPLPASVLSGDPCQDALTSDQLKLIFGMVPSGKRDDIGSLGPGCNWNNVDTGAMTAVGYTTQQAGGLSAVYAGTKPQATIWRELPPIQGLPAVAHSTFPNRRNDFCQVSVGISDEHSFDASLALSFAKVGKVDACDVAARVADMVVTNLRHKAGA
ncbi:DUF3558 domain-containing protein [Amycolatopsis sp. NPDC001319]|uniref:DUF3558 domain-containing protein n=1 Tax=unclassified Amycolatopsis TaxID=2618356 RepID=UPI0036B0F559